MSDIQLSLFDIETGRLQLRPLNARDEALFCDIYTDAEILRFVGPPLSMDRARRSFQKTLALMQQRPMGWLSLAILEKKTDLPLGICGVPHFDAAAERLEVGILLFGPARGAGFAREAKIGLMQRLFSALPVGEIWVEYDSGNTAAERSNISIGFLPHADLSYSTENSKKCVMSACRGTWRDPGSNANNRKEPT